MARLTLLAEGRVHDWNWILSELSLRNQAPARGRAVGALGLAVPAAALALLGADGWRTACYPRATATSDRIMP